MHRLFKWLGAVFAALYLFALGVFFIGTFGLFEQPTDQLAGAYLVMLGWPWNLLIDYFPHATWPWLAALCPLITLLILRSLYSKTK